MLRASDGTNRGTVTVGDFPFGLAFDGASICCAVGSSATLSRLSAKTGAQIAGYVVEPGSQGVLFDGASIWVACYGANSVNKMSRP